MTKKAKISLTVFIVIVVAVASAIGGVIYGKIQNDINGKNQSNTK